MVVWHLQPYHDIKISRNGCYQFLLRNKLNRSPENIKKRSRNKFKRYEKSFPDIMFKSMLSSCYTKTNMEIILSVFNIPLSGLPSFH